MSMRLAVAVAALLLLDGCGGGGGSSPAPVTPQSIATPAATATPRPSATPSPSPRPSATPTPRSSATPSPSPSPTATPLGMYDERRYGARCDGHTDDMAAIQSAEQAAAKAALPGHGTVVQLPAGVCTIGGPIAWDSNVSLLGAGMTTTTLTALASFTYDATKIRSGPDGKEIGMIWLDGPTQTSAIENVTIENLGFDPRAGTQNWSDSAGLRFYDPILDYMRPVHNLAVQHVYFELGANPSAAYTATGTEGPKAFVGVYLGHLGVDPLDPSHDVVFNDVHAHNGDGMLRFGLVGTTKNGVTSSFYNLTVTNEYDSVDLDNIEDDRLEIDGLTDPYGAPLTNAPLGMIHHLVFENINVAVAPNVNVGSINALRLNSSFNTEIEDVTIVGINYVGSPSGYGPIVDGTMHAGTGSVTSMNGSDIQGYINDVTIENVNAQYTIGVGLTLGAPPGQALAAVVRNVVVHDAFIYGGIAVTFTTPKPTVRNPDGPYDLAISNVTVDVSPQNQAPSTPIGIDFHRHLATAGDDHVELQNVTTSGSTALLIEPGFDGMLLDNVHWTGNAIIESPVTEVNSGPN
jgi:hypothetical protein